MIGAHPGGPSLWSRAATGAMAGLLLCAACDAAPQSDVPRSSDPAAARPDTMLTRGQPGVRFDPVTLRLGQQVGTLVVDSIDIRTAFDDSTRVGTVRFRGELTLAGATRLHFDADARGAAQCFEADSASASVMPRWLGDDRRPWFCFDDPADATVMMGPPSEGRGFTIVVDRFTIHRGFSDQVNAAHLISVMPAGSTTERP